jgi:AcrR family transcriptional regulator
MSRRSASKGATTREQIVDTALRMAGDVGLEGVTLGTLAEKLGLSKSGLFAHFRSKEALQLTVVSEAVQRFIASVARPAVDAERGAPRVEALAELWLAWSREQNRESAREAAQRRGCVFLALASEYDDRPGPVRDAVVTSQRDWIEFVAGAAQRAIDEGHFRADLDPRQFAFEFVGVGMSLQYFSKLVGDRFAERRARQAFAGLVARSRVDATAAARGPRRRTADTPAVVRTPRRRAASR